MAGRLQHCKSLNPRCCHSAAAVTQSYWGHQSSYHQCFPQPTRLCCRGYASGDDSENHDGTSNAKGSAVTASEDPPDEVKIPGAQSGGKKLAIVYTCKVCETRSIKQFSEHSYENGVVLVRCPGCENLHLIADRLGMFEGSDDGTGWDIQKALARMGENVNVVNNDNVLEMSVEDLVGKDAMEKLTTAAAKDGNAGDGTKS